MGWASIRKAVALHTPAKGPEAPVPSSTVPENCINVGTAIDMWNQLQPEGRKESKFDAFVVGSEPTGAQRSHALCVVHTCLSFLLQMHVKWTEVGESEMLRLAAEALDRAEAEQAAELAAPSVLASAIYAV